MFVIRVNLSNTFYYHGDHLGSSNFITDKDGEVFEHMEYMPYGETWIEEGNDNQKFLNYLFTSKEFDSETGLYYFGARYLDPTTSRWMSCDPALASYLPVAPNSDEAREHNKKLPNGGIYIYYNLNLYHYCNNNPLIYNDPDGKHPGFWQYFWKRTWNEPGTVILRALQGDTEAQYILKLSAVEIGIMASETGSTIGNGMVICGTMNGNPFVIIAGATIENISDSSNVVFYFLKATLTEKPEDWENAWANLVIELVSSGIGDFAADEIVANPATKKAFFKFLRETLTDKTKGAFKKVSKEAGKKVIEQIIEEGSGIIIEKVYKYENNKKNNENKKNKENKKN